MSKQDILARTYKILQLCIPDKTSAKLSRMIGRSTELVRRWRRPPDDDEEPSGRISNPLDVMETIQDHAFAHAPEHSHLLHLYLERRWEQHFSRRSPKSDGEFADLTQKHVEVIEGILAKLPPDEIRREWENLKRDVEAGRLGGHFLSQRGEWESLRAKVEAWVRRLEEIQGKRMKAEG